MKEPIILVIALVLLSAVSCADSVETVPKADANPNYYLSQSPTTEPGELTYLYENLLRDNQDLCALIKKQLIHPLEVTRYGDAIPEDRHFEDTIYLSVNAMLRGLLEHDSSGLIMTRKPEDRLMVACLHHSLLFASIVRQQGTPVRIRVGFAPYIGEMVGIDVSISHVVCEVWNDDESRWMYIDPDRNMVDFPSEDFVCGAEAWLRFREGDIETRKLKSAFFREEQSILDMLRLDLHYALCNEIMYWGESGPPDVPEMNDLTPEEMRTLDKIAVLMKNAGSNQEELKRLRDSVAFLKD